jgi:hypothetical protein
MTNEQIMFLAMPHDHGSAREWCFTGDELFEFARALESHVLAEKPEPIYQKKGGIAYGMISWIDVDKKTFDKATIKRIVYAAPKQDAQTGE